MDEVQKHEKFSKHFSSRRDSEIVDLTMIRHQRLDLWLISPNPALVNSDVRNLVTQYFWLEVVGAKTTKCYCFTKVYNSITKSIKQQAYDEFVYTIEEKYHKLYKSTEDGIASGRNYNFNVKLWGFIGGLVLLS
nr:zonular occludens toxin domain-containing protein [Acinetobacter baumannii]